MPRHNANAAADSALGRTQGRKSGCELTTSDADTGSDSVAAMAGFVGADGQQPRPRRPSLEELWMLSSGASMSQSQIAATLQVTAPKVERGLLDEVRTLAEKEFNRITNYIYIYHPGTHAATWLQPLGRKQLHSADG